MNDLQQLENLRQEMIDRGHRLAAGLQDLDRMIAVTRDGAMNQIRGVIYRLEIANAEIDGELQRLHAMLTGRGQAEAPALEERFTPPRYLQEAAE